NGVWVDGTMKGELVGGWVQMLSTDRADLQIDHGFSGTGVWDVDLKGFAGIIVANKKRGENQKPVSFMIPATLLQKAWPDLSVKPARGASSAAPQTGRPFQLPAVVTDFTGRADEIRRMVGLFRVGGDRVAVSALRGMGGVGKTTLALKAAHEV